MLLANVIGDLVFFIFKSLILVAIASILLLLLVFGWNVLFDKELSLSYKAILQVVSYFISRYLTN
jgi:hypothetical protein